jgi:hypothetical protein
MSGQVNRSPTSWGVIGNIAPIELSYPTSTAVYSATDSTLTLETAVSIDGFLLKPLKIEQDFPP